jgi:RNA polymerase sigma factor (sigma-70 family)
MKVNRRQGLSRQGKGHPLAEHESDLQDFFRLSTKGRQHSSEMVMVVGRLTPRLTAIARTIFRNAGVPISRCDPDDAVQDLYGLLTAKAIANYGHFNPLHPVVYKIHRHRCISMLRSSRHGQVHNSEVDLADTRWNPHRVVELAEFLKTSLDRMSRNQKQAVTLRHVEGMSARQAAKVAGARPRQVNRWAYEGRNLMKQDLRRQGLHWTDL